MRSDGTTDSTSIFKKLQGHDKPAAFLTTISDGGNAKEDDLLVVKSNGEIQCLNGSDLDTRWISPASTIAKNTTMPEVTSHMVHFAQLTDVLAAKRKLFKDRQDIPLALPTEANITDDNRPLLVMITSPTDLALVTERTLHIIALPSRAGNYPGGATQSVQTLFSISIPWLYEKQHDQAGGVMYNLHVSSGVLYQLNDQCLTAFDLTTSRAKVQSQFTVDGVTSFLPLSSTAIITASPEHVYIYHPKFQSIQASVTIKPTLQTNSRKRKIDGDEPTSSYGCTIVAYSPKQSIVHAILGNDLVAFQIEAPQVMPDRRRALGLLIDSIGCGISSASDLPAPKLKGVGLKSFGTYLPGSNGGFDQVREDKIAEMDGYVVAQDIEAFESLIVNELGLKRDKKELCRFEDKDRSKADINGTSGTNGTKDMTNGVTVAEAKVIPPWVWPKKRSLYPEVDPRWLKYVLSRIFTWSNANPPERKDSLSIDPAGRLVIVFVPHNVIHWLIETGRFTRTNIEGALRHELQVAGIRTIPAGQLVEALVEVDPELKTLLPLLSSTCLDFDAIELLCAIRILMQSLELFEDKHSADQLLLTNGDRLDIVNDDVEAEIELEEERANNALRVAEFHLGDDGSFRGRALSLALEKLHSCPIQDIVSALRSYFASSEVVSLIYLLRFELARGAWTSRYLDTYQPESGEEEGIQENTILLVSELLNCCIDAIGAGGWLSGDATLVNGDHFESEELIASLKLEVSAALEGIEEATYLKGLTAEIVRYGEAVQKGSRTSEKRLKIEGGPKRAIRPITLPQVGRDAFMLPVGLKAEQQVSLYRVGAGGEIQQRTARDIGRLKSKKVGKYTRERIVI